MFKVGDLYVYMDNNIYFLLRFGLANAINDYESLKIRVFIILEILSTNHQNLCFSAVEQSLLCSQKAGVKCLY